MKLSPENILRVAILAGGLLLGTGTTIGVQQASTKPVEAVKPVEPVKPQIIHIRPVCPAIYLDNVKISK